MTGFDIIADDIGRVAASIRKMGADRAIVNEMAKEIRAAVPPIRAAVRANALAYLPGSGGLGAWVAKSRVTAAIRRARNNASVTLVGGRNSRGKRSDIKRLDAGSTRHPTFGHAPWTPQTVRAGFFTEAVTDEGVEAFRAATVSAVDNAVRKALA